MNHRWSSPRGSATAGFVVGFASAAVVAGLGLDVKVHDAVTAYVRGDNIGDTRYDSALGYPGLPRAIVIGLRFRLSAR